MQTSLVMLDAAANGGGASSLIMIVVLIVIFYFFMIRPQQKKQKEIRKFRESIKEGDRVITAGGIHGRVKSINNNVVNLQIAKEIVIKVEKNSVYPSFEETAIEQPKQD